MKARLMLILHAVRSGVLSINDVKRGTEKWGPARVFLLAQHFVDRWENETGVNFRNRPPDSVDGCEDKRESPERRRTSFGEWDG